MICKIAWGIGIGFALANVALILLWVDNMALMQLFMEGCFIALFVSVSCGFADVLANQQKIIDNQNKIISNTQK